MNPFTIYPILEFITSHLFLLIFTVNRLLFVSIVQLSPLQLVLTGAILEATVFLFEIPTGILADVRSRRQFFTAGLCRSATHLGPRV